ncbi:MAG: response regulator transcription factor [Chloroflexota bacterium]
MVFAHSPTIKVMIVDDHAVVRSGLSTFLSLHDDISLVSSAHNGSAAIDYFRKYRPDITLVDLVMPDIPGVEVIRRIRSIAGDAKLVVLTSFNDSQLIREAIAAGAVGCVFKDTSGPDLAKTIRSVYEGNKAISHSVSRILNETRPDSLVDELSKRELEVLKLIASGLTTSEMAYRLDVKPSTVKTYISRLYTKLNVYNRAEATAVALEYRLIS